MGPRREAADSRLLLPTKIPSAKWVLEGLVQQPALPRREPPATTSCATTNNTSLLDSASLRFTTDSASWPSCTCQALRLFQVQAPIQGTLFGIWDGANPQEGTPCSYMAFSRDPPLTKAGSEIQAKHSTRHALGIEHRVRRRSLQYSRVGFRVLFASGPALMPHPPGNLSHRCTWG